jgi:serine/threonine-protein kinase ATR
MVGYVVGLGDRHSENILLDERTGEVLHVDLNCIFQQGETFSVPERVPFRFTPNIRDGCGLGKGEGTFRRAAELSLAMLRSNRVTLLSVLEAMAHDPLLDWIPRSNKQFSTRILRPIKDPKPPSDGNFGRREMQAVEDKLLGLPPKSKILAKKRVGSGNDAGSSLPMSASGQVDMLISEAKSVQNLSAMYVGWASWL